MTGCIMFDYGSDFAHSPIAYLTHTPRANSILVSIIAFVTLVSIIAIVTLFNISAFLVSGLAFITFILRNEGVFDRSNRLGLLARQHCQKL